MSPKVSVIIPAFNMGRTVLAALSSVRAQTFRDFEIVVIDDGSSDDTAARVGEFIAGLAPPEVDRIRYLHQTNSGKAIALNAALKAARGELIALLDADDTLPPDSLKSRVEYLESNPDKGAVFGDAVYVDESGRVFSSKSPPPGFNEQTIARGIVGGIRIPLHPMTIMHRRRCLDIIGYHDPRFRISEDIEFAYRLFSNFPVGYVGLPVYNYHPITRELSRRVRKRLGIYLGKMLMVREHLPSSRRIPFYVLTTVKEGGKLLYSLFSARIT